MKTKINKKGISLTILIVTIIVVIMLAAIVVLTLSKNNPLDIAREASFKEDIRTFQNELNMVIAEQYAEKLGKRKEKITALEYTKGGEKNSVYTYLSSFSKKYENKIAIEEDKIVYIGKDKKERMWMGSIAEINPMLTVRYVKENGEEIAPTYENIIANGYYEVESPMIEGYEPDHYTILGDIEEDTEITVTYYPWAEELEYVGLDSEGNETDVEENIVSYKVVGPQTYDKEVLVIPRENNNKPVTAIKMYAFRNSKIRKAVITNSIKSVDSYIFTNSNALEELVIDIESFVQYAPAFCQLKNLKKVVLGKNVNSIGIQTFQNCPNLTDVTIYSNSIERLGAYTFAGCNSLEKVKVNSDNNGYKEVDGVIYSKDGKILVLYPPGKQDEEFKIESSVEEIGERACANNNYLKKVELPSSIKKVKGSAFNNCNSLEYLNINAETLEGSYIFQSTNLKRIDIGENVKSIPGACFGTTATSNLTEVNIFTENADITGYQFLNCTSLKKFTVNEGNSKYIEIDGVLYSKDGKTLYACPPGKEGEFYIPESVETIRKGSFQTKYPNITKLVLPTGVKTAIFEYTTIGSEIYYNGTLEQWNKVTKKFGQSSIKTVHCTDGDASI